MLPGNRLRLVGGLSTSTTVLTAWQLLVQLKCAMVAFVVALVARHSAGLAGVTRVASLRQGTTASWRGTHSTIAFVCDLAQLLVHCGVIIEAQRGRGAAKTIGPVMDAFQLVRRRQPKGNPHPCRHTLPIHQQVKLVIRLQLNAHVYTYTNRFIETAAVSAPCGVVYSDFVQQMIASTM